MALQSLAIETALQQRNRTIRPDNQQLQSGSGSGGRGPPFSLGSLGSGEVLDSPSAGSASQSIFFRLFFSVDGVDFSFLRSPFNY